MYQVRFRAHIIVVALIASPGAWAIQTYSISQIAPGSFPRINDSGVVVFHASGKSWKRTPGVGTQEIVGLPGYDYHWVTDIGNSGHVVGQSENYIYGGPQAFLIPPVGTAEYIGFPWGSSSNAYQVNGRGEVTGLGLVSDGGVATSFFWSRETGAVDLIALLGFYQRGFPNSGGSPAINDNGIVAGLAREDGGYLNWQTYLWSRAEGVSFIPNQGMKDAPTSINIHKEVVGTSDNGGGFGPYWFRYAAGAVTTYNSDFYPSQIADSGVIVGSSIEGRTAKMWTPQDGLVEAATVVVDGQGWQLQRLSDVNSSGKIVGTGINPNGQTAVFMLTPVPEPATSVCFAVGFFSLLGWRRARERKFRVGL